MEEIDISYHIILHSFWVIFDTYHWYPTPHFFQLLWFSSFYWSLVRSQAASSEVASWREWYSMDTKDLSLDCLRNSQKQPKETVSYSKQNMALNGKKSPSPNRKYMFKWFFFHCHVRNICAALAGSLHKDWGKSIRQKHHSLVVMENPNVTKQGLPAGWGGCVVVVGNHRSIRMIIQNARVLVSSN